MFSLAPPRATDESRFIKIDEFWVTNSTLNGYELAIFDVKNLLMITEAAIDSEILLRFYTSAVETH